MNVYRDKVAVITGAGGGIGRALAFELAARGARLALSDVNAAGLAETARRLPAGSIVRSYDLDVARRAAVFAHADEVRRDFGAAHFIFNNAGVTLVASVEHATIEEMEWLLGINLWGVIYGTKAFLPLLRAQNEGHIVNFSSIFGFVTVPGQSAYHVAKFGVRGFTECLAGELAGTAIKVSCVHPGGIRTGIGRAARLGRFADDTERRMTAGGDRLLRTPPADFARVVLREVARGNPRIVAGHLARSADWLHRLFPVGHRALFRWLSRRRNQG